MLRCDRFCFCFCRSCDGGCRGLRSFLGNITDIIGLFDFKDIAYLFQNRGHALAKVGILLWLALVGKIHGKLCVHGQILKHGLFIIVNIAYPLIIILCKLIYIIIIVS